MKTMKKVLALILVVALTATVAVNVTLAYLQDQDEAVNVMTLGNVYIDQIEQERNEASQLVDFTQDKPLYPAVYEGAEPTVAGGWFDASNAVDKVVSVKNTGKSDAYVRTVLAFETVNGSDAMIHKNKNTTDWTWTEVGTTVIEGETYAIWVATYNDVLKPGQTTVPSLYQVALDKSADNEDVASLGDEYKILAVSQAIQVMGFEGQTAEYALNAGFNPITTTAHPWTDGIIGDAWDGTADAEGLAKVTDDAAKTVTISTAEQLAAFAAAVNGGNSYAGYTVELAASINLGNQPWTPIGACDTKAYFQGTFDGKGYTISNLKVDKSNDPYKYSTAGLFGWIDAAGATITNVNVNGATVSGSHWVGVIAGFMTGDITGCTVTNATVVGNNVNDDANGDKVGGIVGYVNSGSGLIDGNTVSDSTIIGNRDIGGLAGAVATTNTVTNNTVEDVVLMNQKDYVGEIVSPKTDVVVNGSNVAKNVTIVTGAEVAPGVIQNGKTYNIMNKQGLMNLGAQLVSAGPNEANILTVNLMADIDLSGETWEPITTMWITFNGNNHTISNLNAGKDADVGRSGFFGYAGAITVNDLTLKNVTSCGTQAGTFAGSGEGLKLNNCYLQGTNSVTWEQNPAGEYQESWSGIGAITGVLTTSNINVTITDGTTVALNYKDMTTGAPYVDTLTGYIQPNNGTVTNNGTINVSKTVSDNAGLAAAVSAGAKTVYLTGGEYELKGNQTDGLTIIGQGNGVKISNLTNFAGNGNLGAIWKNVNFENVIFTEKVYTMADGAASTFKNCTFEQGFRGGYSRGVSFDGCTFYANDQGFAMHFEKVYTTLTVNNCKFVKGTIAFGDNGDGMVTFNGCTFSGDTTRTEYFDAWASCELNNCTFEKPAEIWHEQWETGETCTLNNVTGATVAQK